MTALPTLGIIAALFLALPWLAIAFNRYCDTVNRLTRKRRTVPETTPCNAAPPPTTPGVRWLCTRCGMLDSDHQEKADA